MAGDPMGPTRRSAEVAMKVSWEDEIPDFSKKYKSCSKSTNQKGDEWVEEEWKYQIQDYMSDLNESRRSQIQNDMSALYKSGTSMYIYIYIISKVQPNEQRAHPFVRLSQRGTVRAGHLQNGFPGQP